MKSFNRPWFIAGGWTIDLAIGELTRAHKDMDICIFREDLDYAIAFFGEWDIKVAIPGEHRLEPFQTLSDVDLPRYCLHLFRGNDFLEILATEQIANEVIFRKNRNIRMNIHDFSKGKPSRPYVNPAWQLLFKSLGTRKEDEHDFKVYLDRVNDEQSKKWLLESMIEVNGNKSWIEALRRVVPMITIDKVRQYALSLPESKEVEHWGKPSFRINNKIFAIIQEDGITLTIKTIGEDRMIFTTMDSKTYRIPDSFTNLNYMHVNLNHVDPEELKGLILKAWRSLAPKRLVKQYGDL